MSPSVGQIILVVLIILVLFGAGRLPRLMEDLAKGMKAFKKGMGDEHSKNSRVVRKSTVQKKAQPNMVTLSDSKIIKTKAPSSSKKLNSNREKYKPKIDLGQKVSAKAETTQNTTTKSDTKSSPQSLQKVKQDMPKKTKTRSKVVKDPVGKSLPQKSLPKKTGAKITVNSGTAKKVSVKKTK